MTLTCTKHNRPATLGPYLDTIHEDDGTVCQ